MASPNSGNFTRLSPLAMLALLAALAGSATADDATGATADDPVERGREIAFDRNKGNCLACHQIEGGELAGNVGPPLLLMETRFPDRDVLRSQVWDASEKVPNTRMPMYGRHRILTETEIDLVVDFLLTL